MESCQPHPNDIMGMILQASQLDRDVNMEDLVDEFITFFVAGKYTTKSDWELMVSAVDSLLQRWRFLWGRGSLKISKYTQTNMQLWMHTVYEFLTNTFIINAAKEESMIRKVHEFVFEKTFGLL